ncbi:MULTISPECIES: efflux RND transporter periplasmic adaptor subunit [unclassified Colwellia]|uniref:efflux RND transporter periplasmic adaptor subunit n=1 Tax=unclassified Colwellia TaxID=196834 RepID=UPI0015F5DBDC|nr:MULTISPECIES: efflux RND transporter periplasmic adaptor subunit [unclassified Colwellia]MBA6348915.1 efflux RND transporter periplasmic adaptor subunit [Colwellia sp. BRX8-9]MBA6352225.1 efflux RND transporter periplasmic adaptor subunit [Colwellia sp. BRX9-1]MBA6355938.1 efflux RND transporter periplasmic adaptor subunit [Colwellia sp. BRX8-3]MBA6361942.1 efflux RND transporter periplasmic adaptor subunit [Colwellia sp. BRX8-6]MBA6368852.1 efflux RND transporter periplasmic adaptor subuni
MKKILIIIVVIIGLVSLAYFKKTGQSQTLEVKVQQVAAENIKRSILASGTLVYKEQVQLRSEVIGQVSEMLIEEGDEVTKGQVLMRLEPRTFRADVEQQAAFVRIQKIAIEHQSKKIENLKSQWQRKHDLYQRKILDRDAYELIDNQYALAKIDLRSRQESLLQAQATLDKAQERLDKTVFRSPIKGIATSVDIKQGETAISGSTNISGSNLITLADPSSILIEVEVDEADIANILVGQQADIFAVAFPDKALKGQVQSIATTAKRAQGRQGLSFKVKILLSDSNTIAVRPGMSCRAEIYTQSKSKTIAVPSESVIFATQGKNVQVDDESDNEALADNVDHVFVLIDGKAVKQNVELGISNDRLQEITSGLKVGDKVIIGPARALGKLKDAQSVKVIDKEA